MTLTQWLRAQLDADQATASEYHHELCDLLADDYQPGKTVCSCGHPDQLLAEIKAKRAILDEAIYLGADEIIQLLAQPYAGRDGWQPEWTVNQ
jgi:hypothetical protein